MTENSGGASRQGRVEVGLHQLTHVEHAHGRSCRRFDPHFSPASRVRRGLLILGFVLRAGFPRRIIKIRLRVPACAASPKTKMTAPVHLSVFCLSMYVWTRSDGVATQCHRPRKSGKKCGLDRPRLCPESTVVASAAAIRSSGTTCTCSRRLRSVTFPAGGRRRHFRRRRSHR